MRPPFGGFGSQRNEPMPAFKATNHLEKSLPECNPLNPANQAALSPHQTFSLFATGSLKPAQATPHRQTFFPVRGRYPSAPLLLE